MTQIGAKEVLKKQEDHLKKLEEMKINLSMMTKDWDLVDNKDLKNFPRLANRFKVGYKSNLDFSRLIVNKPPHRLPEVVRSSQNHP